MTNAAAKLAWASSGGGPLIAVEERHMRHWLGIDPPTDGRVIDAAFRWDDNLDAPATDYDRACDIEDYTALLPVGQGNGLVLSYECTTAWWPAQDNRGGIFVRWQFANSESDVIAFMSVVPELPLVEPILEWTIEDRKIYLFDSACSGQDILDDWADNFIALDIQPGHYTVSTSIYKPDNSTLLLLHRIDPVLVPNGYS